MKLTTIFSLFVILCTSSIVASISYKNRSNGKRRAAIVTSGSEDDSDDDSDSEEFDEEFENQEGPEENPKCENAKDWPRLYPTCKGLQQSPINIKGNSVQTGYKPVSPLCWKNYDAIPISTTLINAGHTIQMQGKWQNNQIPGISCGILGDAEYQFEQWHCHWAKNNVNGSDHTFNGRPYPMECHFVHFRKEFGTFQNASTKHHGVAVVAYLYDIKNEDTFPIDIMGPAVLRLVRADNVSVMPIPLAVYVPTFADNYVTYQGSLTTPPCSESVIWIINIKAQKISHKLMKKFRRVAQASECLINNFRQVQELNGRDIILVPDKNALI